MLCYILQTSTITVFHSTKHSCLFQDPTLSGASIIFKTQVCASSLLLLLLLAASYTIPNTAKSGELFKIWKVTRLQSGGGGERSYTSTHFSLCVRWGWVASFILQPFYSQSKDSNLTFRASVNRPCAASSLANNFLNLLLGPEILNYGLASVGGCCPAFIPYFCLFRFSDNSTSADLL